VNVLLPLPRADYDPSEAAIAWATIVAAGHTVTFATPDGKPAQADPVMLTGCGLDFWGRVPGLRRVALVGLFLRADARARRAHVAMAASEAFRTPLSYADIDPAAYDGLMLPGGHAKGVREYLDNATLQRAVAAFFAADKAVGAICHGVVLAARSVSASGRSVLHGRRTTALTWDLERAAWNVSRWAGRWWDRDYYRTYVEAPGEPVGYRSVEAEVTRALAAADDFCNVPADAAQRWRKTGGLLRDTPRDASPAFVVRDGRYVSARWPGDVHTFASEFVRALADASIATPLASGKFRLI
jgi:putative intracellular protease/amidase